MTQREKIKAYADLIKSVHPDVKEIRYPMTTADATVLAGELSPSDLNHPDKVSEGLVGLKTAGPPPKDDVEAIIRWGVIVQKSVVLFWDGFSGQVVDGVEVIRRA